MARWRWDAVHRAVFPHQGLDAVAALRPLLSRSVPNGGDWSTVNVGAGRRRSPVRAATVPGYREIIDLSPANDSRFLDAVGAVGPFLSPHYDDFLADWRAVQHRKMRMERAEIDARRARTSAARAAELTSLKLSSLSLKSQGSRRRQRARAAHLSSHVNSGVDAQGIAHSQDSAHSGVLLMLETRTVRLEVALAALSMLRTCHSDCRSSSERRFTCKLSLPWRCAYRGPARRLANVRRRQFHWRTRGSQVRTVDEARGKLRSLKESESDRLRVATASPGGTPRWLLGESDECVASSPSR